jgi:hypothetical protein
MTSATPNVSSLPHRPNNKSFPATRQPYWRDPRIQVVTETRVVVNMQGGWVVDKKKYLEYPEGWTENRMHCANCNDGAQRGDEA